MCWVILCLCVLSVGLVKLSVPVQVIDWKDSVSEMTFNVLMGTLNPTHSLSSVIFPSFICGTVIAVVTLTVKHVSLKF